MGDGGPAARLLAAQQKAAAWASEGALRCKNTGAQEEVMLKARERRQGCFALENKLHNVSRELIAASWGANENFSLGIATVVIAGCATFLKWTNKYIWESRSILVSGILCRERIPKPNGEAVWIASLRVHHHKEELVEEGFSQRPYSRPAWSQGDRRCPGGPDPWANPTANPSRQAGRGSRRWQGSDPAWSRGELSRKLIEQSKQPHRRLCAGLARAAISEQTVTSSSCLKWASSHAKFPSLSLVVVLVYNSYNEKAIKIQS